MFASCSMGLVLIAFVILLMGIGGAPGAILYEAGIKSANKGLSSAGFLLTALGQSFVVCAYTVLVVSALRTFATAYPNLPMWPLWIAAFVHATAAPGKASQERPEVPNAQHPTLGLVGTASFICLLIMIFSPSLLKGIYGWVPYFAANLKG